MTNTTPIELRSGSRETFDDTHPSEVSRLLLREGCQSTREKASNRIVYLMRGLPSCGKSFTAKRLIMVPNTAKQQSGIVCETDEYFYSQVGVDRTRYDYDPALLPKARVWNFARYRDAIEQQRSPIVVDRGNGLNAETKRYATLAIAQGYQVELAEPKSEWWQELRVLLKYKEETSSILDIWAMRLAHKNRETHRTPAATIRKWMSKWRSDLTIDDVLSYGEM